MAHLIRRSIWGPGALTAAAFFVCALLVAPSAAPSPAFAQGDNTAAEEDIPAGAGESDFMIDEDLPGGASAPVGLPSTPLPPPPSGERREVVLEPLLAPETPPIPDGVVWRIFATDPTGQRLGLASELRGGSVRAELAEGTYFVHAAYGRAGVTKRIEVGSGENRQKVVINAGGLRLAAFVGKDTRLPQTQVSFDIFVEDGEIGERTLVIPDANAEKIIRLNAGTYHVIGRYGDANAVVRADVSVQPGKLTDAILYHKAAKVTLKLVAEHGGEALANTAWSVLTTGGDSVFNSVGAFPAVVLAAGQYTAIAQHDNRVYRGTFIVETDLNRDIEVLAGQ